jgi:two-component system OmpR family sensor kinase
LDLLLNEFSKIEQLVSKSYTLNKQEYPLSLILEHASDLLMLDQEQLQERLQIQCENDPLVFADFDLLSLALKNLLDNGLKYGSDKKVHVKIEKEFFSVSNLGPPLNKPIEHYLEAFVTSSKAGGKGMGLGLYIIKNILELHGYGFDYLYEDGMHNFFIYLETHCDIEFKKEK